MPCSLLIVSLSDIALPVLVTKQWLLFVRFKLEVIDCFILNFGKSLDHENTSELPCFKSNLVEYSIGDCLLCPESSLSMGSLFKEKFVILIGGVKEPSFSTFTGSGLCKRV